jgi:hypothetical protein
MSQRSGIMMAKGVVLLLAAGAWAQSPDLPGGPLKQKARTACMECHDARIIVQQRLDRKAWTKEVDKMIRWGAVVDPKERTSFIDYFSTHFGTNPEEAKPTSVKPKGRPAP